MPRSIWKGNITFGLVQIPVDLYPAEESNELSFSLLDRRNMTPIRYERVNRETGKPVPWDDIVRGYQYEEGEYVVMSDEDLRQANVEATQTVDILDFVDVADIDPRYFEKPYYLAPTAQKRKKRSPPKAYVLLREALRRTRKVGIAKVVIRTRERLAAVMPSGEALVLNLLRFSHELRDTDELDLPAKKDTAAAVQPRELAMAERLVGEMASAWEPEKYKDEYRDDVMKLIEKKVKSGKTTIVAEPSAGTRAPRTGNVDIIALLKKSLAGEKRGERNNDATAKRKPASTAKKRTAKTAAQSKGGGSKRAA